VKTGLGIYKKYRKIYAYINYFRFWIRKKFIGFDVANLFIQRVDKISLQLILKKNGSKIGKNSDIETGIIFHNCKDYSNLVIGNNCHIGKNCFFDLRDCIEIENNVVISMQCSFITHIDLIKSILSKKYIAESAKIKIESNSYLGTGTIVLMGVTIGEKSFIAASSLVNKNVKNNTVVGGIPSKVIKAIDIG